MVNTGSRLWFGVVALGVVGALAYLLTSGGELYGTLVLAFTAVAGVILGVTSIVLRDGDVSGTAGESRIVERRPVATRFAAPWPALAALGAGVCMIGLVTGGALFYVGVAILGVTLVEWMVQSWAERSTADATLNQELRNRVMFPVEMPALALIGIAVVIIALSRVLLAVSQTASTVTAIVVASVVLGVASLLSARPRVSSSLLAGIIVVGVVGLLGGGIVSAVAGEREFEVHGAEHHDEEHHDEEDHEEGVDGDDDHGDEGGAGSQGPPAGTGTQRGG